MRILVLGGDGYLGWPTAMHFSKRGDEVWIIDNFAKRRWEMEEGIEPLRPIAPLHHRVKKWNEVSDNEMHLRIMDLVDDRAVYKLFEECKPDAIVHYAEQPSAPYSMQGRTTAVNTQVNNIVGNLNVLFAMQKYCPDAHLIKLGTMGEYGTPNIDIEEGWLELEHNGRHDRVLFPKKPHSFYHLSKVHDSHNIEFVCRVWGLRSTDLNQGVVYGIDTDETQMGTDFQTSFHYDDVFGTVLNRFLVQAATDHDLTVYGSGKQTRGFLNLRDTIRCVEIAADNPPEQGEFRVFNQFTEQFSVMELAAKVQAAAKRVGKDITINHLENPRVEQEEHYYNAKHTRLVDLGLEPVLLTEEVLDSMLATVMENCDHVDAEVFKPRIKWSNQS
ncbi:NAD-dependent epimerase/dehydratase family protein [Magnetovibrio sp. PR-2]|uniref:NAD-dependent epimerase/dehydratase family protein n=1 Tax=Magnetovibrio sp. PR-2 TaxID=3120356 RepID=UPI002FCE2E9A